MASIDIKEIIGKDALKGLEKTNEELKEANKLLKEQVVIVESLNKEYAEAKNTVQLKKSLNKQEQENLKIEQEKQKILLNNGRLEKQALDIEIKRKRENERILKQQEKQNKVLKDQNSAYTKLSRRLNEQRKLAKDLAVQYGTNSKQFKQVAADVGRLDKKLKGIDKSLGQSQRNVGNYAGGFKTALTGILTQLGLIGGGAVIAQKAFQAMFSDQSSIEFFRVKLKGVSAQLDILKDDFSEVGMVITESGENQSSVFAKLTKAVSFFAKQKLFGIEKALELETVGAAAEELERSLISLEKVIADSNLLNAQRRRDIQELIFLTRDETVSFDERRAALEKANELEKAILNTQIENQKERVRIIEENQKLSKTTEEERVQLVLERTKLYELETLSLAKQRELLNRINELENKRKAANQRILKDRQEETKLTVEIAADAEEQITLELTDELKKRVEANKLANELNERNDKISVDKRKAIISELTSQIQAVGNSIFEFQQTARDRNLERIRADYDAQIAAADGNAEQQEALARQLAKKQYEIELEQAKSTRTQALFDIAISTAVGAAKALEAGPAGVALAAINIAAGAAQAALVAAQPLPEPPQFAEGGITPNTFIAGEAGRELMVTKDGQMMLTPNHASLYTNMEGTQVLPNSQTEKILQAVNLANANVINTQQLESKLDELNETAKLFPREIRNLNNNRTRKLGGNSTLSYKANTRFRN
jgi:hypothetical protein